MRALCRFSTEWLRRGRDRLRRRVVRLLLDRETDAATAVAARVVFVRWDGKLGDTVVMSWLYRELKHKRPDLRLTVLTHEALLDIHHNGYGIEDVIACSKRPGLVQTIGLARRLRHAHYVVHLAETLKPRDFLFIRCVAPAEVVGLDDSARCVNFKLGMRTQQTHFSGKLVPWARSLGIIDPDLSYDIPVKPDVLADVKAGWPETPVTGFCPYGAGANRRMSDQTIIKLVTAMREISGHRIVMLASPDDSERLRDVLSGWPGSQVLLPESAADVDHLFARISLCDLVVSVDTAVVHVATGLNKPQLAIYNPDSETHQNYPAWHPNSAEAITLFARKSSPQHVDAVDLDAFRNAYRELLNRLTIN